MSAADGASAQGSTAVRAQGSAAPGTLSLRGTAAPAVELLDVFASTSQRVLRSRGLVLYPACSRACTVRAEAQLSLSPSSAPRHFRSSSRRLVALKESRMLLRLPRRARAALRRSLARGGKPWIMARVHASAPGVRPEVMLNLIGVRR